MKPVEKMFPHALRAVEKYIAEPENKTVKKVYNGYVSSFGASIIQSGMLPAIANLDKETGRTEGDKKKIADAILCILKEKSNRYGNNPEFNLLSEMALKFSKDKSFKTDLTNAVIALKLAIRMFKLDEGDKQNGKN